MEHSIGIRFSVWPSIRSTHSAKVKFGDVDVLARAKNTSTDRLREKGILYAAGDGTPPAER